MRTRMFTRGWRSSLFLARLMFPQPCSWKANHATDKSAEESSAEKENCYGQDGAHSAWERLLVRMRLLLLKYRDIDEGCEDHERNSPCNGACPRSDVK